MALMPSPFDIASRALGSKNKGFSNARGNTRILKNKFIQNVNAGEKLTQPEFEFSINGMPELTTLARAAQFPQTARNIIEDTCHGGGKLFMYGSEENSGEVAVTLVETIEGRALKHIRDIVSKGQYVTVTFSAIPESNAGIPVSSLEVDLLYCVIRCEAVDFSTEDTEALVKPTLTITYNDLEFADDIGLMDSIADKGIDLIKRVISPINLF